MKNIQEKIFSSFCDISKSETMQRSISGKEALVQLGRSYIYSHNRTSFTPTKTGIAGGSSTNFVIENPVGSGKTIIVLYALEKNYDFQLESFCNVTIETATAQKPFCLYIPQKSVSTSNIYIDNAFAGGITRANDGLLGGDNPARAVIGVTGGVFTVIEEGNNMAVRLTNRAGSTADLQLNIQVYEIDN